MPTSTPVIQSVTGKIKPEKLGRTLMHEHVMVGYPGWDADWVRPGRSKREMRKIAADKVEEMRDEGIKTMIDPCPADLGRDIEFIAEVASKAKFNIVAATGLYHEHEGGSPHWKSRTAFGGPQENFMAEMMIKELTSGVGKTGIKAGIIKVATSAGVITEYEKTVLRAAAKASIETGAPITTHTDRGTMGPDQQKYLTDQGVPAHRIIIGHSCGTSDHDYHMKIAKAGSYLGFDRFGLDIIHPDAERVSSLLKLLKKGAGDRIVVSHDTVWCWRGEPIDQKVLDEIEKLWTPSHFTKRIVPKLLEGGASQEDIDKLLIENPRRFFAGDKLAALAG
ncbi:MAG TPA: phosphotriesterase-related protein [Myxococcota bacterium]|nr:phosphotriesterase-related protein [Myxococcota bacterium]